MPSVPPTSSAVHRDFREGEEGLEQGARLPRVAGADHQPLELERRRTVFRDVGGGRRQLDEHAGTGAGMQEGDATSETGTRGRVEELDAAVLQLAERAVDVRRVEAQVV